MIAAGLPADDPGLKPESIIRWRAKTESQGPLMYGHPTGGSAQAALDLIGMIDNKANTADDRLATFLGEPLQARKLFDERASDCFAHVRL